MGRFLHLLIGRAGFRPPKDIQVRMTSCDSLPRWEFTLAVLLRQVVAQVQDRVAVDNADQHAMSLVVYEPAHRLLHAANLLILDERRERGG